MWTFPTGQGPSGTFGSRPRLSKGSLMLVRLRGYVPTSRRAPPEAAELAPSGPGDQGTYQIKNLEATPGPGGFSLVRWGWLIRSFFDTRWLEHLSASTWFSEV